MGSLNLEEVDDFIFKETDFFYEDDSIFSVANFIRKYQRIMTIGSLKEQLHKYCGLLKNKLYKIINEEYSQFINIAAELDGVNERINSLRPPLVGFRLDMSTLHDGIIVSVKKIEDKL